MKRSWANVYGTRKHIYDVSSPGCSRRELLNSPEEIGRELVAKAAKKLRSELCTALWWMCCLTTTLTTLDNV